MNNTQKMSVVSETSVANNLNNLNNQMTKVPGFATTMLRDAEVEYPVQEVRPVFSCGSKLDSLFGGNELMQAIVSDVNILEAIAVVRQTAALPYGEDAKEVTYTCNTFQPADMRERLRDTLLCGEYQPAPTKYVRVPKGNGNYRHLSIASPLDQIVQQMIVQVLCQTHTRAICSEYSFAYIYNEGVEEALDAAKKFIRQGCRYAVHFELNDFFRNIPQETLYEKLEECIGNQEVIELIMSFMPQDKLEPDTLIQLGVGSPHGSPLAHYLGSIIYLDELDRYLEDMDCKFVRYEDDLTVFFERKQEARELRGEIQDIIELELECPVFRSKSPVIPTATMDVPKVIFHNNLWHLRSASETAVATAQARLETALAQHRLLCA